MWHELLASHVGRGGLNYYFNISLKNRYTYTEVPKCACTTLKGSLGRLEMDGSGLGPEIVDDYAAGPHRPPYQSPFVKPYQLPDDVFDELVTSDDFTRFAFVRNPYARAVSAYLDKIRQNRPALQTITRYIGELRGLPETATIDGGSVTFSEYVAALAAVDDPGTLDPHLRPQTLLLADLVYPYDYIGRIETFDRDYQELMDRLGQPEVGYVRHPRKTNASDQVSGLYDPRLAQTIADVYQDDFVRLGYSTDITAAG